MTPPPAQLAAARSSTAQPQAGTILHGDSTKHQQQQQSLTSTAPNPGQPAKQPVQVPNTSGASTRNAWSAMSAIAGGSAAAAVGQYKRPAATTPRQQAATGPLGSVTSSSSSAASGTNGKPRAAAPANPGSTPSVNLFGNSAPSNGDAATGAQQQAQQQQPPGGSDGMTYVPRMADKHVSTVYRCFWFRWIDAHRNCCCLRERDRSCSGCLKSK